MQGSFFVFLFILTQPFLALLVVNSKIGD